MKKILCIVIALVLAAGACAFALTHDEAADSAASVTQTETDKSLITSPFIGVIDKVQPSVVGINNYQNVTRYSGYPNGGYGYGFGFGFGYGGRGSSETVEQLYARGSGVVVYEGFVLTNYHVVEDATRLTVSALDDETEYACTLIAYDEALDVAVVYAPELKLSAVPLGDSDQLQVGEWVMCIGNPIDTEFSGTVTTGIVSALNREISSTTTTDKYGLKTQVVNTMIQTDAAINNGNSGGGLFNTLGQLMGVPSIKYSGLTSSGATIDGIGLAIPINSAKPVISEAIINVLTGNTVKADDVSGTKNATVSSDKPMLGVTGSIVTASNYYPVYAGLLPTGMLIDEVTPESPAARAGIQAYDIIVEVDSVMASSMTDIRSALDAHSYGDTITVKVYRCEGLADAQTASDIGKGEYIDLSVNLFEFNMDA